MKTNPRIKKKWIGEWVKVPYRFICNANKFSVATSPPYSLIQSIAAKPPSIMIINDGLQTFHHEKIHQACMLCQSDQSKL